MIVSTVAGFLGAIPGASAVDGLLKPRENKFTVDCEATRCDSRHFVVISKVQFERDATKEEIRKAMRFVTDSLEEEHSDCYDWDMHTTCSASPGCLLLILKTHFRKNPPETQMTVCAEIAMMVPSWVVNVYHAGPTARDPDMIIAEVREDVPIPSENSSEMWRKAVDAVRRESFKRGLRCFTIPESLGRKYYPESRATGYRPISMG